MATVITTRSGTEYYINRSLNQETYVRWEDASYKGHPGMQGGKVKIVEHVKFHAVPEVGTHLKFQGINRYTGQTMVWETSTIMKMVRNGVEVQTLAKQG